MVVNFQKGCDFLKRVVTFKKDYGLSNKAYYPLWSINGGVSYDSLNNKLPGTFPIRHKKVIV